MLQKSYKHIRNREFPTEGDKKGAFAKYLKKIRVLHRIPGKDLAEASEVYKSRLSEYEHGKRLPTEQTLARLINGLRLFKITDEEAEVLREAHDMSVSVSSAYTAGKMRRHFSEKS